MKYRNILVVIMLVILMIVTKPSENYYNCKSHSIFRNLYFKGIVSKKYLDKNDHSVPKVEINNITDNVIRKVDFWGDYSNIYSKINVFDTVLKDSNSLEVFVKIDGGYASLGKANFHCDEVKFRKEIVINKLFD